MSLGVSFLLLAAGAILRYAVEDDLWKNVNEDVVGAILMVIGALGILLTIFVVSVVKNATSTLKRQDRIPRVR